eukprot:511659-Rhodomonas_salina.1
MGKGGHVLCGLPSLASHRKVPVGFRAEVPGLAASAEEEGKEEEEEEEEEKGGRGHGVECSACGEEVRGVRFKCGNCVRFELCAACYDGGLPRSSLSLVSSLSL